MKNEKISTAAEETQQHTLCIGGYSNQTTAEVDAKDFGSPNAFLNRSGMFGDPARFRVKVQPVTVEVRSIGDEASAPKKSETDKGTKIVRVSDRPVFNSFYIELLLDITGQPDRIAAWVAHAQQRINVIAPTAHKAAGA